MTPLILFLLWALVCAEKEATEDFKLIAANKPVHHTVAEWWERAQIVLLGGLVCVFIGLIVNGLSFFSWSLLLWLPAGWAAFTSGFRWFLNRKRKLDWRYVSPSNLYDRFWISLANKLIWGFSLKRGDIANNDEWYHNKSDIVRRVLGIDAERCIHRAGLIAYAFELSILTASTILYALA